MKRSEIRRYTALRTKATLTTRAGIARRKAQSAKRVKETGPSKLVVALVLDRDGGCCIRCNTAQGLRSTHHRRPRRAGGDRRPDANSPANLVTLCGSGTTGCHGWVEQNRAEARRWGWLLAANDEPSAVPLRTWWGPALLDHEGRWSAVVKCPECRCDPVLCETDMSGEHCMDQWCGTCMNGCPLDDCLVCNIPEAVVSS